MKKVLIIVVTIAIISSLAIRAIYPTINLGNEKYLEDPIQEYYDNLKAGNYDEIYQEYLSYDDTYEKEEYIDFIKELYSNIDYNSLSFKLVDSNNGIYDILCHNAYLVSVQMKDDNVRTIVD